MISFIGCGGAGGNVVDEAVKHGFYGVAINYSQRDLDALEFVEHRLKLKGSEGVGKNREQATALLAEQYDSVVNWLKEHLSSPSIEVIIFTYATSGGSGSGISPLLVDLIQSIMPEKTVVALPIIPDETEDSTAQLNCLAAFEEMSRTNVAIYPIDNQQVKKLNPTIPKNKLYEITNTNAIHLISTLTSYIDKSSKNGNFDKKDLLTILQTKGIGHICEINFMSLSDNNNSIQLTPDGITKLIHDQWEKSIFSPLEFNYVTRAGIIFDGEERFTDLISHQGIFSAFDNGMPIGLYEGIYHESSSKIVTVLGGLPWINTRLKRIEHILEQNKQKIETVIADQQHTEYTSSVSDMALKIRIPAKPVQKLSPEDILAKYKRK